MRKKAKYLEDTPTEALSQETGGRSRMTVGDTGFRSQPLPGQGHPNNLFAVRSSGASSYGMYGSTGPMPVPQKAMGLPGREYSMAPQSMAMNPSAYELGGLSHSAPVTSSMMPNSSLDDLFPGSFDTGNLDFTDFDNRYGAAEFGMLNHMSTGMANSPPSDGAASFNPSGSTYTPGTMSAAYAHSPSEDNQFIQAGPGLGHWSNESSNDVRPKYHYKGSSQDYLDGMMRQDGPPAFAIGNSTLPSPSSIASPQGMALTGMDDAAGGGNLLGGPNNPSNQSQARADHHPPHPRQGLSAVPASTTSTPSLQVQTLPSRRYRTPSTVYEDVRNPYSYTAAFHSLTALIQRRFSPHRTAHIAKALAAIRPSFISCTMKLNKEDLVFMEKCLQRTLWEYEDFISATATPTIICRRTGEVVAVGKEFSILTGWTANVLLGREPNLNVNVGVDNQDGPDASSLEVTNTLRSSSDTRTEQPVNIVDLLDDDSVCDFFDDYAHLAFGDSRGSVTTPCKLLKYRALLETRSADGADIQVRTDLKRRRDQSAPTSTPDPNNRPLTAPPPAKVGRSTVDCMLCWSVKRDVFDIPMLCVLNVSTSSLIASSTLTYIPGFALHVMSFLPFDPPQA